MATDQTDITNTPKLPGREIQFDGEQLTTETGAVIPPGEYLLPDGHVITLSEPPNH